MAGYTDIARLWVEQAPKGPRKAGTFWRDGAMAGHWSSCIARFVDSPVGKVVLISENHWGTYTAAFINQCADMARKAGYVTFIVTKPSTDAHEANLKEFERQALACEAKIAKAKSVDWQAKADAIRAERDRYAKTFGLV